MKYVMSSLTTVLLLAGTADTLAAITEVPVVNPAFEQGLASDGVPKGWHRYGGGGATQRLALVTPEHGKGPALLIEDGDEGREIGVQQTVPLPGAGRYEVSAAVCAVPGAITTGAYVQLRFLPSGEFEQRGLNTAATNVFETLALQGTAPAGTTHAMLFLYTHKAPTPTLMIDHVQLFAGLPPAPKKPPKPPKPPAAPKPVPPVYEKLKDLHLPTALVKDGTPTAAILTATSGIYDGPARDIQLAILECTGTTVPIIKDDDPAAKLPLKRNAIVLGNRSTNGTINALYDKFYTLVDLKYPGPEGFVLRTVHNPLGDGKNAIVVGGSDAVGVEKAASALVAKLAATTKGTDLVLDWIAEIELGKGVKVPKELKSVKIWEESRTYGSSGYFGWNVVSKRMALYYMTGDEFHAREFLRLAFPDAAAIKELEKADGERIENKHDPLAGPYHYSAHMMIQFWDLIEESPFFTDEQRLRITNAFSRQLTHRAREHVYGRTRPGASVGNRHGDWSAMSLYSLARYFQKDYPNPIWQCALDSVEMYFAALRRSAWLAGKNDHLFWYTSYYDPILDYMITSGDHTGLESGNLQKALRTQDVLYIGNKQDWGLKASSLNFLQRAAYLTGDGRFLFYRARSGVNTAPFRLGQSFWADDNLKPRPPIELLNTWTVQDMPEPF